jgi:3-methyladenine DNA glycosylase AlkD
MPTSPNSGLTSTASDVSAALAALADPQVALGATRFFQTGPGQYGEGDLFVGIRMPALRTVVKRFAALPLAEVDLLLDSPIHEYRMAALLVLVAQFEQASKARVRDDAARARLAAAYLQAVRRGRVNNWDLVDSSAPTLLGAYHLDRSRDVFVELAASPELWERRVAMIGTLGLIMRGDARTALDLAALLLDDPQPLIHKAVGWMLREVGKRIDRGLLLGFLEEHAAHMPRTALSYATEHLSSEQRAAYRAR